MRRSALFIFFTLIFTTCCLIYYQQQQTIVSVHHEPYEQYQVPHDLGNIPEVYLRNSNPIKVKDSKRVCVRFPKLYELAIVNDVWQYQELSKGRTLHLFSAYLDERQWLGEDAVIRILAMYGVYRDNDTQLYCQLWFDDGQAPIVVKTQRFTWIWIHGWGGETGSFHHPYIISCPLPRGLVPISVSLVEKPCARATNNLAVVSKRAPEKKNFAVCVKGLNFPEQDNSAKLCEWIETLRVLGADTVHFYEFSVHPNVKKVLSYYENLGAVTVQKVNLVGRYSNRPYLQNRFLKEMNTERRLQEVIPYNDCFYRHLNDYRFVVLLDTDEIIAPVEATWLELMHKMENWYPNKTSYVAQNVYFFSDDSRGFEDADIPEYMHMLRHVYRAAEHNKPGFYVKGFHSTERIVALHNHFPLHCERPYCDTRPIDVALAQLNHYRAGCVRAIGDCARYKEKTVLDTRLWQFKTVLVERVTNTLEALGLLNELH